MGFCNVGTDAWNDLFLSSSNSKGSRRWPRSEQQVCICRKQKQTDEPWGERTMVLAATQLVFPRRTADMPSEAILHGCCSKPKEIILESFAEHMNLHELHLVVGTKVVMLSILAHFQQDNCINRWLRPACLTPHAQMASMAILQIGPVRHCHQPSLQG